MEERDEGLSNAEIADRLASLAQLLSSQKENRYKVRAYQRAATKIRTLSESIEDLVRNEVDLTRYAGVGEAIAAAIREIVQTGQLGKLEKLRSEADPALAGISAYPRLDPARVLRVYGKLGISTVDELRAKLESRDIERLMGARMSEHVRQGLTETHAMLLYRADDLRVTVEEFLLGPCGVRRAKVAGDYRRRVEVVEELVFVIETEDFPGVITRLQRYGGRTPLLSSTSETALFSLSSGIPLRIQLASEHDWGWHMVSCTGSKAHLQKLKQRGLKSAAASLPTEDAFYEVFGCNYIEPELREGHDEVEQAARGDLPVLLMQQDICGDLHAHSTSSDGSHSIEQMAAAAQARGYRYLGITDHSQSLKIARGVSVQDLWEQIRFIDKLNSRLKGFQVLKSAEVDILENGSLDYPDDLLRELDYTVCSIHSRFSLGKSEQTDRILRAMDNRYFNILGHATGRKLLRRPGYEIDVGRVINHARQNGCFFEINSSPERLDLPSGHARQAFEAGVRIAVTTDAHSTGELGFIRCGIDQARRAGLAKTSVLNCLPWRKLAPLFRR